MLEGGSPRAVVAESVPGARAAPVAASGRGDVVDVTVLPPSFEEFFEMEQGGLFGALRLITGNRHDAEELTQEAFLKLWERWDAVGRMENPTGYLYRTALNAYRMRRRRAVLAAHRFARRLGRRDDFAAAEARREIDQSLLRLTPRQRAAVVLTELLEFNSTEAAEALGSTPANVRKLASQGREVLRRAIGAEHD
jgi:RNA polymerase sigma-70 factor, ECF subfamily